MSDDWDDDPPLAQYAPPHTQPVDDETTRSPAAVLWVPDPEQRSGWREFYVQRARPKVRPRQFGYTPGAKKR